jgi:ferredoxin-type protein NapH
MSPFMILGNMIKNKLKYPSLHLRVQEEKCINCSACTKKCPMSLEVMDMVHKGNMHNSECILCGECIDGCPKAVISYGIKNR